MVPLMLAGVPWLVAGIALYLTAIGMVTGEAIWRRRKPPAPSAPTIINNYNFTLGPTGTPTLSDPPPSTGTKRLPPTEGGGEVD